MNIMALLQQANESAPDVGWLRYILDFIDTPAPYSPFSEYLLLLFVLWLIARRHDRRRSFDTQAQEVLDDKYAKGEISQKAYEKYRQDVSLRPKR
jgi:hypothetical protein